jgi:hypothetical protein
MAESGTYNKSLAGACVLVFVFSFFTENQITDRDIDAQSEVIYVGCEKKKSTGKSKVSWLEFKFSGTSSTFQIEAKDYEQFNLKDFRQEVQFYDTLTIKSTDCRIFQLSKKGGKEYTNLQKANNARKKEFIWLAVMSVVGFLYCLINTYHLGAGTDVLFFIIWVVVGLITHGILVMLFGSFFSDKLLS